MKVQLLKNKYEDSLLPEKVYSVLSIEIYEDETLYRIFSERESPIIYDCELFEIVSNRIPSLWTVNHNRQKKFFHICPQTWAAPEYWVRYFDAEPEAVADFDKFRKAIEAEC